MSGGVSDASNTDDNSVDNSADNYRQLGARQLTYDNSTDRSRPTSVDQQRRRHLLTDRQPNSAAGGDQPHGPRQFARLPLNQRRRRNRRDTMTQPNDPRKVKVIVELIDHSSKIAEAQERGDLVERLAQGQGAHHRPADPGGDRRPAQAGQEPAAQLAAERAGGHGSATTRPRCWPRWCPTASRPRRG